MNVLKNQTDYSQFNIRLQQSSMRGAPQELLQMLKALVNSIN